MKTWNILKEILSKRLNAIVRLPQPWNSDSQRQKTFLAPYSNMQIRNYETVCSNHHSPSSTLRSKGLSCSKMKWWTIYTSLPVNAIVRLPHFCNGDGQGQETYFAPPVDKKTGNYDTECCAQTTISSLSTLRPKGLSSSKMKWCAIYTNLPINTIVRLPHPWRGISQVQENIFSKLGSDKQTRVWNAMLNYGMVVT